jgi:uncharacterized protein (TIGR02598 family)
MKQPEQRLTAPTGSKLRNQGFSLVETVLALGIMALGITAILGLLPQGLEMSRKAAHTSTEGRITADILGQLSEVNWENLSAQNNTIIFFDEQAVRLDRIDREFDNRLTYVVRLLLPKNATQIPGSGSNQTDIQRVGIQIAAVPNSNYNFDTAQPSSYSTQTVLLARTTPLTP